MTTRTRLPLGLPFRQIVLPLAAIAGLSLPAMAHHGPYLLTHGECQLPVDEVQQLASRAPIYGVFILPSDRLELEYLDHLYRVHIIDDEALSYQRRAQRARQIISDVESGYDRASARAGGRARRPAPGARGISRSRGPGGRSR